MKLYTCYTTLLFTILLFVSCAEDPVIPKIKSRKVREKSIDNIPEALERSESFYSMYKFCINNSLYLLGYCPDINGEPVCEQTALYEYNTGTKQWNTVWYILERTLNELEQSGQEENRLKAEELRNNVRCLNYSRNNNMSCEYDGKGYIFTDQNKLFVFDSSTREMTTFDYNEHLSGKIFSNSNGIFTYVTEESNRLYKLTTDTHQWQPFREIYDNDVLNYFNSIDHVIHTPQDDKIYIRTSASQNQYSIKSYTYPYETTQNEGTAEIPHDYGWDNYNYNTDYGLSPTTFSINGKIYLENGNTFYEYNPEDKTTTIVFIENRGQQYYTERVILAIIKNKVYVSSRYTTDQPTVITF